MTWHLRKLRLSSNRPAIRESFQRSGRPQKDLFRASLTGTGAGLQLQGGSNGLYLDASQVQHHCDPSVSGEWKEAQAVNQLQAGWAAYDAAEIDPAAAEVFEVKQEELGSSIPLISNGIYDDAVSLVFILPTKMFAKFSDVMRLAMTTPCLDYKIRFSFDALPKPGRPVEMWPQLRRQRIVSSDDNFHFLVHHRHELEKTGRA